MEDLFKKFLYTGVGFVALTAEKFQKTIDKLVSENKISTEEGRKIVDDFLKNTSTKREEFESQLKSITEKVVRSFDFATAHEVKALKDRVDKLEAATSSDKPAAKSTPPKKSTSKT
jgi:polyhydroxyalkanoate synthesis regulator phasin